MKNYVVFTDLDGTLLDHTTYSYAPALPALNLLKALDIPLLFCTSKTRKETLGLARELGINHPFITENGGGIFIPYGYPLPSHPAERIKGAYRVIVLGASIEDIRTAFKTIRKRYRLRGFSDMSAAELAREAGLSELQASAALERDFSEPFLFLDDERKLEEFAREISALGFRLTRGGRFFHLIGPHADKGEAVSCLAELYRRQSPQMTTLALGDSPNDLAMLKAVDMPFLVQRPDGTYDPEVRFPSLRFAGGVGPEGWNRAILEVLHR
jgi:mannosyl-3-phosphoglycerate phosphatase